MALFRITIPQSQGKAVDALIVDAEDEAGAAALANSLYAGTWDAADASALDASPAVDMTDTDAFTGWTFDLSIDTGTPIHVTHVGLTGAADIDGIGAALKTALNATAINGADYAAEVPATSPPTLTVAAIADGIGDKTVTLTITPPGGQPGMETVLVDTVTDGGIAAAALVVEFALQATLVPAVLAAQRTDAPSGTLYGISKLGSAATAAGATRMVVSANSAAEAQAMAGAYSDLDGGGWGGADSLADDAGTKIYDLNAFLGWRMHLVVYDPATPQTIAGEVEVVGQPGASDVHGMGDALVAALLAIDSTPFAGAAYDDATLALKVAETTDGLGDMAVLLIVQPPASFTNARAVDLGDSFVDSYTSEGVSGAALVVTFKSVAVVPRVHAVS